VKATTVRFGDDLWALLEAEAAANEMSVSQYVREAALARAAFSVGARGGGAEEMLAAWTRAVLSERRAGPELEAATQRLIAALTLPSVQERRDEAVALRAASRQARRPARDVRGTT
jgi:hypothetical protein